MTRLAFLPALLSLSLAACVEVMPPPPLDEPTPDAGEVPHRPPPPADAGQAPDAPALFRVGGPLELPGAAPASPVRLGVLWFPALSPSRPERPRGASSGTTAHVPPLPSRWALALTAPPPAAARGPVATSAGGAGAISFGVLVAFRDGDGDGQLTVSPEGASADELLASSAGAMPFDLEDAAGALVLVWREGTVGDDEPPYERGFNLVRLERGPRPPTVLPPSVEVPLTLAADARLALPFCAEAWAPAMPEVACGARVFRTPRVQSELALGADGVHLSVSVLAGQRRVLDAKVTIDGWLLPEAGGHYALFEPAPQLLLPGRHTLRVEAPGFEPVELRQVLPSPPRVLGPVELSTVRAGSVEAVRWVPGDEVTGYAVSFTAEDGAVLEGLTTDAWWELPVPSFAGAGVLRVAAQHVEQTMRHTLHASAETVHQLKIEP